MKAQIKEILIYQATVEELPKVSFKEVTFSIEPMTLPLLELEHACISFVPDLVEAKRVRKPVVLHNKDLEELPKLPTAKNPVIFESKKILPDVALFRWHRGFRHFGGRYTRVNVLKLELYYPDDLHDILGKNSQGVS